PAGSAEEGGGVLRGGLDPGGGGRQGCAGGCGSSAAPRRVLRQLAGVSLEAGCGASRNQGGCVVRQRVAAAQRLGVGPELSRGRRGGGRGELRQGQGLLVRTGDHVSRPAARDVQVLVQRDLRADECTNRGAVGVDVMVNEGTPARARGRFL